MSVPATGGSGVYVPTKDPNYYNDKYNITPFSSDETEDREKTSTEQTPTEQTPTEGAPTEGMPAVSEKHQKAINAGQEYFNNTVPIFVEFFQVLDLFQGMFSDDPFEDMIFTNTLNTRLGINLASNKATEEYNENMGLTLTFRPSTQIPNSTPATIEESPWVQNYSPPAENSE